MASGVCRSGTAVGGWASKTGFAEAKAAVSRTSFAKASGLVQNELGIRNRLWFLRVAGWWRHRAAPLGAVRESWGQGGKRVRRN